MENREQAIKKFNGDIYAVSTTGIVIEQASPHYAKCRMEITEAHLNAAGVVMGGALFTLADFTFAVAANNTETDTVSLSCHMDFIAPGKGKVMTAEASCVHEGRTTVFYTVTVTDETGKTVARLTATGYRIPPRAKESSK